MDTFSALADPTRRNIIEVLAASGQLSASAIAAKFHLSFPAISQHLKVLREARLVYMEKKAQQRIYQLNPDAIMELEKWAQQTAQQWEGRFERLDKVLSEDKQLNRKDKPHGRRE